MSLTEYAFSQGCITCDSEVKYVVDVTGGLHIDLVALGVYGRFNRKREIHRKILLFLVTCTKRGI